MTRACSLTSTPSKLVRPPRSNRYTKLRHAARQLRRRGGVCHQMALRFHQGGKLVVFGTGGSSTDAQHVAD